MAVFSKKGGSNGGSYASHFTGQLTVWEKSYDIASNSSKVGRKIELISGSSGRFSGYGANWSINVDGQTKSGSGTYESMSYNTAQTIYEDEITVVHNADGSKKNMSCSATLDFASGTYSPGDFNLSGTMDLTTIPRASSISATDANIGSTSTVMINRASDSFTHTVEYSFNGLKGTIATKTKETVIPFNIPTTFFEKIPETQSGIVTLTCYTYSGDTHIGTKTTTITVNVPTSSKPVIESATAVDTNKTTLALTEGSSRLVKYFSDVKVNVKGKCLNYAGFSKLRENNQIDIPATTEISEGTTTVTGEKTFGKSTNSEYRIVLVDTRQLPSDYKVLNEENGDFTLIPYIPLTMSVEAKRVSPTSNSAILKFSGNFYNGYYDEAKNNFNDLTIKWRYKLRDSGSWITTGADDTTDGWHNLTLGPDFKYNENEDKYSSVDDIVIEDMFDYQENYIIEIMYQDRLSSYTTQKPILEGEPNHDYGKDVNGKNYFNVNGNLYENEARIIESGSNSNGNWTKWSDGTMIVNQIIKGTADITTEWGSLYTSDSIELPNFPIQFIERPTIAFGTQTQTGTQYILTGNSNGDYGSALHGGSVCLVRPNSRTGVAYIIDVIAKGKWK